MKEYKRWVAAIKRFIRSHKGCKSGYFDNPDMERKLANSKKGPKHNKRFRQCDIAKEIDNA